MGVLSLFFMVSPLLFFRNLSKSKKVFVDILACVIPGNVGWTNHEKKESVCITQANYFCRHTSIHTYTPDETVAISLVNSIAVEKSLVNMLYVSFLAVTCLYQFKSFLKIPSVCADSMDFGPISDLISLQPEMWATLAGTHRRRMDELSQRIKRSHDGLPLPVSFTRGPILWKGVFSDALGPAASEAILSQPVAAASTHAEMWATLVGTYRSSKEELHQRIKLSSDGLSLPVPFIPGSILGSSFSSSSTSRLDDPSLLARVRHSAQGREMQLAGTFHWHEIPYLNDFSEQLAGTDGNLGVVFGAFDAAAQSVQEQQIARLSCDLATEYVELQSFLDDRYAQYRATVPLQCSDSEEMIRLKWSTAAAKYFF
jgi:hypothetical protein